VGVPQAELYSVRTAPVADRRLYAVAALMVLENRTPEPSYPYETVTPDATTDVTCPTGEYV
jgi:hypothetical protein